MSFDPDTGEVREAIPASERVVDVVPRDTAADGLPVPARSRAASNMLKMLNDGAFDAELSHAMHDLLRQIESHAHNNKGQAKGSVDIKLSLTYANGMLVVVPDFKTKAPAEKPMGTALFIGEDFSLGRNPPGQRQMFGSDVRDPDAPRVVRDL